MNSLSQDFLEDFPRKSQPEACETMGSGFERRGGGNARSPPLGDSESPDVDSMPRQKVTTPSGEGRWEFALGTVYPVLSGKLALAIFSSAEDAQQAAKEDQDHIYFTTGLHDGRFSTHFGASPSFGAMSQVRPLCMTDTSLSPTSLWVRI